jgi:hypothetical protein
MKEEHLEHLAEVLRLLDEAGLCMKVDKCHFLGFTSVRMG